MSALIWWLLSIYRMKLSLADLQRPAAGRCGRVDVVGLGEQIIPAVRSGATLITLRLGNENGFERGINTIFVNVPERITDHAPFP